MSVSLCFSCVLSVPRPSVSGPACQCGAVVRLRPAHLGSCHPHGSGPRRPLPHQSDRSQLRQSASVLLPRCRSRPPAGGQVSAPTPGTPGLAAIMPPPTTHCGRLAASPCGSGAETLLIHLPSPLLMGETQFNSIKPDLWGIRTRHLRMWNVDY